MKKTPYTLQANSPTEKIAGIASHFQAIMELLGLDLNDPSLQKTPQRVAKMYVEEIFSGLDPDNFPKITLIDDPYTESKGRIVLVKEISLISFCEHHFVPMAGVAHVAYIPNGKLIGLSKINRIVRHFARRPQVQERLTMQIADSLGKILKTPHIAVYINARHHCVAARGIQDTSSTTSTYILRGDFLTDPVAKESFFKLL